MIHACMVRVVEHVRSDGTLNLDCGIIHNSFRLLHMEESLYQLLHFIQKSGIECSKEKMGWLILLTRNQKPIPDNKG